MRPGRMSLKRSPVTWLTRLDVDARRPRAAAPVPQSVSRVINITLPEHVLMAKMLARRVCTDCGRGYNIANIKEGESPARPTRTLRAPRCI
jgi:hypothetical protein